MKVKGDSPSIQPPLEAAEDGYLSRGVEASLAFLSEIYEGLETISEAPDRWPTCMERAGLWVCELLLRPCRDCSSSLRRTPACAGGLHSFAAFAAEDWSIQLCGLQKTLPFSC